MREALARDYVAMGEMIFGSRPEIGEVLHAIDVLESRLNAQR